MLIRYKIEFPGTAHLASETDATHAVVERHGYGYSHSKNAFIDLWIPVGNAQIIDGEDAYVYDTVEQSTSNIYRFRPVYKGMVGDWSYQKSTPPPAPTPVGTCRPDTTTGYTYTVMHSYPQIQGYYLKETYNVYRHYREEITSETAIQPTGNSTTCFVYNEPNSLWLLYNEQPGMPASAISTDSNNVQDYIGVMYYAPGVPEYIPQLTSKWRPGGAYGAQPAIAERVPLITCYKPIPGPTPTPSPQPPPPPPPRGNPVTPTPTASPTAQPTPSPSPVPEFYTINTESGEPLALENGYYFATES